VLSYLRTLTTWHCPHSPAAAAAIVRDLVPAGPTAANLQQRVCCCGPRLEQTDGDADGHRTVYVARRVETIQFCLQPPSSAVNATLLAFAAERRRLLSIDISRPRGAQQQTCRLSLLLLIDGTDRRTDIRALHK